MVEHQEGWSGVVLLLSPRALPFTWCLKPGITVSSIWKRATGSQCVVSVAFKWFPEVTLITSYTLAVSPPALVTQPCLECWDWT